MKNLTNRISCFFLILFHIFIVSPSNSSDYIITTEVLDKDVICNKSSKHLIVLPCCSKKHFIYTEPRESKEVIITPFEDRLGELLKFLHPSAMQWPYAFNGSLELCTMQWPYAFNGSLELFYSGGIVGSGSGTLVGPHHILTAGSCCYNHKLNKITGEKLGYPEKIIFSPGRDGDNRPFEEVSGNVIKVFKEWVESGDIEFNMGLILLDYSIGYKTGWAGMRRYKDHANLKDHLKDKELSITGYPTEDPEGLIWKWPMKTNNIVLKKTSKGAISYDADNISGSGILHENYVIGVHISGKPKTNIGLLLSSRRFKTIVELVQESWDAPINLEKLSDVEPEEDSEDIAEILKDLQASELEIDKTENKYEKKGKAVSKQAAFSSSGSYKDAYFLQEDGDLDGARKLYEKTLRTIKKQPEVEISIKAYLAPLLLNSKETKDRERGAQYFIEALTAKNSPKGIFPLAVAILSVLPEPESVTSDHLRTYYLKGGSERLKELENKIIKARDVSRKGKAYKYDWRLTP